MHSHIYLVQIGASAEVIQALVGFAYYGQFEIESECIDELHQVFDTLGIEYEFPLNDATDTECSAEHDTDIG